MNHKYPELQQFLAGYFNQDWADDHDTADGVINFFIAESSKKTIIKVRQDLSTLLCIDQTESQLQHLLFTDLGCGYYYPHEWKDGKAWLKHVFTALEFASG